MKADQIPQFIVSNGKIEVNQAGKAVQETYRKAREAWTRLNANYAGALVASIFAARPWLQGFTIDLQASAEFDDAGGYYRTISSSISDVSTVDGAEIPEDLDTDGRLDTDIAADAMQQEFEDSVYDLYSVFVDDTAYEDLQFSFTRNMLDGLIGETEIEGHEAFLRLFPGHESIVVHNVSSGSP